ncbi:hypothetical protein HU200_035595 [Digitaria exilis]|uniref:Uncharacterized protein n=1 Tax=Digitaria exilis TaxID=1010633 RepID=A0A835BF73_9POAL|nr:hypothetical protein HU200_035595 [Digitaria exilis]
MPIKTSADKLAREIQQYGNPLTFPTAQESSGAAVMDDGCFLVECMVLLRSTILISSSSQQGLLLSLYTNSYPGSQKNQPAYQRRFVLQPRKAASEKIGFEASNNGECSHPNSPYNMPSDYMDDDLLFPAMQARSECTLDLENQMEETVHVYAENRQVFGDSVQDYELLEASLWSRLVERFGKKPCLNSTGEDTEELAVGKGAAEHGKQVCTCFCVTIFDCVVLVDWSWEMMVLRRLPVSLILAVALLCASVPLPSSVRRVLPSDAPFLQAGDGLISDFHRNRQLSKFRMLDSWKVGGVCTVSQLSSHRGSGIHLGVWKLPKEVIDQLEFQNALPRALIWSPIDPSADNRNQIIELFEEYVKDCDIQIDTAADAVEFSNQEPGPPSLFSVKEVCSGLLVLGTRMSCLLVIKPVIVQDTIEQPTGSTSCCG